MIDAIATLYESGDTVAAWEQLHVLRRAYPDDASLRYLEARFLDHEGHTDRALPLYRRATELDPSDALAWTNLAYVQGQADPAKGIETYRALLSRFPADAVAWANLATLLEAIDRAEAIKSYHTAIALEPTLDAVSTRLTELGET